MVNTGILIMNTLLKINNLKDVYVDEQTNKDYLKLILKGYSLTRIEYDKEQNTTIFFLDDVATENFILDSGYNCCLHYHKDDFIISVYDADIHLFIVSFSEKNDYDIVLRDEENIIINICDDLFPNILGCIEYILARYFNKLAQ